MDDDEPPTDPPPPLPPPPAVAGVGSSTGFLERFRPRCMCRSQYFWAATTSLEHRHFFPSVLRQRPGSGSMAALPQYPDCNTDATTQTNKTNMFKIYPSQRCCNNYKACPKNVNFSYLFHFFHKIRKKSFLGYWIITSSHHNHITIYNN